MRKPCRNFLLLAGLLGLLLGAGCDPGDRGSLGAETDDPQYRRGQQLLKEGRSQEALAAFLKVVDRRGGDAPESHLEAGLLYQQFKDPISAIYHYRRYLQAAPNSRQADLVRQRQDAAMREFARLLPAQPLENQTARFELMEKIDELQRENQQLKDQIAAMNQGGGGPASRGPAGPGPAGGATPTAVMRIPPFGSSPAAVRPTTPARAPATAPASPPAGRTHVVAQGETLYKIAQRYYGSGGRWPEILQANRDQLKNENSVRPGMTLRIP